MFEEKIDKMIKELPSDLKGKLYDYIEYLHYQNNRRNIANGNFSFEWEDALSDLANKHDSVSLQHESLKWR